MAYHVRRGSAADIPALEPLWVSMVDHHDEVAGAEWPVRDPQAAWAIRRAEYERWLGDGSGTLFIARDAASEAIGYAMLQVHPPGATWDLGAEVGELESLAVARAARGAGVGSALVEACREVLRHRGITHWSVAVVEANDGAVRLYEREGFRPYYRLMLARLEP